MGEGTQCPIFVTSIPARALFDGEENKWILHKGEFQPESVFIWLSELDLTTAAWSYPPRNLIEVFQTTERPWFAIVAILFVCFSLIKALRDHFRFARMRHLLNRKTKSSPWQGSP
jgi:hypothetical protein